MQQTDSKLPGYFITPSVKDSDYKLTINRQPIAEEPEISNSFKRELVEEPEMVDPNRSNVKPVVCVRCQSLRHYGKVKDATVENLLPDFDFDHTIGRKLVTSIRTRSIVLMVVDASDFDGAFPRNVAKLVSESIDENLTAWKNGKNLVDDVCQLAGARGNVWAIGAQNAGKSTLINSIGKHVSGKITHLTEAPVPGTTLGIVRVEGILPGNVKLFDTLGLLNPQPHQITTRLTREEQKMVHVNNELRPRTYRIKAGHTVHIAGLMRLDVEEASSESVYITVWASPYLLLHMRKTENVSTMLENHFGLQLQFFELGSFTGSKVVSSADRVSNKNLSKKPKKQLEQKEVASDATLPVTV
ncbi:hypothetical protein IFM89_025847 [Coptis chinensis]|uniref:G domain-containing protein n=1 Tax=Coptis chinensis TaxID=261450 RepID=A0A835LJS2_9MAGN|nr:hypothetical protein IFM89_025847 [Coptis chinensis]